MNCRYCGAGLPTKGGVCPECGKMIPIDQQKQMREMLDPKWNEYKNQKTAFYNSSNNQHANDSKIGKLIIGIILLLLIIIIIAVVRGG